MQSAPTKRTQFIVTFRVVYMHKLAVLCSGATVNIVCSSPITFKKCSNKNCIFKLLMRKMCDREKIEILLKTRHQLSNDTCRILSNAKFLYFFLICFFCQLKTSLAKNKTQIKAILL